MPPKSNKTKTGKKFKISKNSTRSGMTKLEKLNQLEMLDIVPSSTLKDLSKKSQSLLDAKSIKRDKTKDDENREKDKKTSEEANGDLLKQLDSIL